MSDDSQGWDEAVGTVLFLGVLACLYIALAGVVAGGAPLVSAPTWVMIAVVLFFFSFMFLMTEERPDDPQTELGEFDE